MKEDAKLITRIIKEAATEERGELLLLVAEGLKKEGQGYTSSLFAKIALEYGFKTD